MTPRGRKPYNENNVERAPWLKSVYCPKCGRKISEVNMADGYFTCGKCRYNFYKIMIGGFEVNVSAELIDNNRLVRALLKLIRCELFKILLNTDITKTAMIDEQIRDEDVDFEFPYPGYY